MSALVAGLLAALAFLAWTAPAGELRLGAQGSAPRRWRGPRPVLVVPAVIAVALVAVVLTAPGMLAWAVIVCAVGSTLGWVTHQHRRDARAARNSAQVARACEVIAGQLQIGRTPGQALATAAEECEVLVACASAHQVGADVTEALAAAASEAGCAGLSGLARTWRLCERTGSRLSPAAQRVAQAVAAEGQLQSETAAELAVPRATGKLLAMLPVVGVAMGFLAGGDPVSFLTSTLPGRACLAAAVLLACAGLMWTELIASRAGRQS